MSGLFCLTHFVVTAISLIVRRAGIKYFFHEPSLREFTMYTVCVSLLNMQCAESLSVCWKYFFLMFLGTWPLLATSLVYSHVLHHSMCEWWCVLSSCICLCFCFVCLLYTLGGSVVILMPAWSIAMGNSGWGEELSHSLKSGWGSSTCSCSTSLSSWGIHDRDKWQLARNTQ